MENFIKYKIENKNFKLIFSIKIVGKDSLPSYNHIMQISNILYFATEINGYIIYKIDKKDEIDSNND